MAGSRRGTPAQPGKPGTARILCAVPGWLESDLIRLCRDLGHQVSCVVDHDALGRAHGQFDLGVVLDDAGLDSPFSADVLMQLTMAGRNDLAVDRMLLLGVMDDQTGRRHSYVHHGSAYCRLEIEARRLTPEGDAAVRCAIGEALRIPPYELVDYFEYVDDRVLHSVVESSQAPLIVLDPDWRVWFANLAAQGVFKRPTQLMKGLDLTELCSSPDSARRFRELVGQRLRLGGGQVHLRMQAWDGQEFDALVAYNRVYFGDNDKIGLTLHDITALVQAERELAEHRTRLEELVRTRTAELHELNQALSESDERHRMLVETMREGLAIIDEGMRITYANDRFCEMVGYERAELIGRHVSELQDGEHRQILRAQVEQAPYEVEFTRRNGRQVFAIVSPRPLCSAAGEYRGSFAVVTDLTEHRRLQHQLFQSQKLESIGTLAGGIAHDFGNVLAVIMGNCSMLQRQHSLPGKAQLLLGEIATAAERGSDLTQQLLAYARGGLQRPVPIDLNESIRTVARMLGRTSPRQVEIDLELAEPLPPIVADPVQIEQVVMNLCLNAIEASEPHGTIRLGTREGSLAALEAEALEMPAGRHVCLHVSDRGCGMAPATAERIFEPFFTTKPMGRGMGLSAALGIIESHHGSIEVDSTPGRGTTVRVRLPAAEGAFVQAPDNMPVAGDGVRGSETVLVVDQCPTAARTAEQVLSPLGYVVVAHREVDAALRFLDHNAEDVDLIVLDLATAGARARETLEAAGRLCPRVPVLLTGEPEAAAESESLRSCGAAGFAAKPITGATLARRVRAALDATREPGSET